MTTAGQDIETLIDTYCAGWNEHDPARRRAILAAVWASGATYTDPTVHAAGLDALVGHIETVIAWRPGWKIVRTSEIDAHHDVARFAWRMVQADGMMLTEGLDLAELSDDGKIRRIVGFFGPLTNTQ